MGIIAIACYKPRAGKETELHRIVTEHWPLLRLKRLASKRQALVCTSNNGTVMEIFEWKNAKAKDNAHADKEVMKLWNRMEKVSRNVSLSTIPESKNAFANFWIK